MRFGSINPAAISVRFSLVEIDNSEIEFGIDIHIGELGDGHALRHRLKDLYEAAALPNVLVYYATCSQMIFHLINSLIIFVCIPFAFPVEHVPECLEGVPDQGIIGLC